MHPTTFHDPVCTMNEIYETITDDNSISARYFNAPITDDYLYVGGFVKGEIVGIMVYHAYRDGNKCHVQVLPEYRNKYARLFGEQSLMFRGTQPLYAEIPSLYQNVLDFALTFGFEVIDKKISDYIKNGQNYDTYILRFNDGICP